MPTSENRIKNKKEKLIDEPAEPIDGPAQPTATVVGSVRACHRPSLDLDGLLVMKPDTTWSSKIRSPTVEHQSATHVSSGAAWMGKIARALLPPTARDPSPS